MCHILNPVMISPCVFSLQQWLDFLYDYNKLKRTVNFVVYVLTQHMKTGNLVRRLCSFSTSNNFTVFIPFPYSCSHLSSDSLVPILSQIAPRSSPPLLLCWPWLIPSSFLTLPLATLSSLGRVCCHCFLLWQLQPGVLF